MSTLLQTWFYVVVVVVVGIMCVHVVCMCIFWSKCIYFPMCG